MSQAKRIEQYLRGGHKLTRLTALHQFYCANLTAVISRLRRRGMDIEAYTKVDANGNTYTVYCKKHA